MKSERQNFIKRAIDLKKSTEGRLQAVGGQIRKNIDQGSADLSSGKVGRNDYINPLKGTVDAFKRGR